jgi:hypothetical protein
MNMKRRNPFKLCFAVLFSVFFLGEGLISGAHAEKKIHRTCFGGYYAEVYLWVTGPGAPKKGKKIGETDLIHIFQARGGCGKSVPDRCRNRARSYAKRCVKSHYPSKSTTNFPIGQKPDQCDIDHGILSYPPGRLVDLLDNAVCSLAKQKGYDQYSVFYADTYGRVRCNHCKKALVDPDFTIRAWLLDDTGVDAGRLIQCN